MSDGRFFTRGKVQEFRQELIEDVRKDPKHTKKREVLKKIVANMTMGNDMSPLFPDVVSCMQISDLEIKKMVYLYLINYAKIKPELVIMAVNSFLKDATDSNPLIRALAIRTMSYINVDKVTDHISEPLRACIKDQDAYVRKTAAIAIVKLYFTDRQLVTNEGLLDELRSLLKDSNPTVAANAIASLIEVHEKSPDFQFEIDANTASNLVSALTECSEWCQTFIMEGLMFVIPQETGEAEGLIDRLTPRLQHANSGVVLTAIKVIMYFLNYVGDSELIESTFRKLAPPLVTLVSSQPEVQYVALRNILLIIQKRPDLLRQDMKVFFCKYNDPIYVKLSKLEIMFRLADESTVGIMLAELKEYATEVDVDFVRKAVRAIGRCAIKVDSAADKCVQSLVELVQTKVNYVVQEAIIVLKDIFRKYPNQYESVIGTLCENLDNLDEPEAKASMVWIIGQYADRIENSPELLEGFIESFLEEPQEVQFALLTATVKMFIKRPNEGKNLVPKILKWATEETDNPDVRDRGYIYWRMLSTDPVASKNIILSEKPPISTETDNLDAGILQDLLLHISSLASIYHKPARILVPSSKHRKLYESPVLVMDSYRPAVMSPPNALANTQSNYNPYSNEQPTQSRKQQQPVANLLDLDDDYNNSDGGTNATVIPSAITNNNMFSAQPFNAPPQPPPIDPALNAANVAEALATISFNGVPAASGTLQSFIPPRELLLPANLGKGMEINGTFSRRNGQVQLELHVTNRALQPLGDFAIQFNKNTFGLIPGGPLQLRSPLPPNQSSESTLPITLSPLTHTQPMVPVNQLQIAVKNNVGVFFFKCNYSLHVLFREDGKLSQQEFLGLWKNWPETQTGGSLTVEGLNYMNIDQLRDKLSINNIFTVAERDLQTKVNLYVSVKLMDMTPFLAEVQANINAPGAVTSLTANVKSSVAGLLPIFIDSLAAILKS